MLIILLCITILYLIMIGSFIVGFDKIKPFNLTDKDAVNNFSIIIAFRNEIKNLPILLASLGSLNYPKNKFELIFVNDDSEDNSEEIIKSFFSKGDENSNISYRILQNDRESNSPKKDAITLAINHTRYDWIVTTDADCLIPPFWLDALDGFIYQEGSDAVVMPVGYYELDSFLKRFQGLDLMSLQGSTIGAFGIGKPFLCNGANFAYQKALFNQVKGFKNNDHVASGDDIFLLEKFLKAGNCAVNYLMNEKALVLTKPQETFKSLVSQRKRWAAKTGAYNNLFGKLVAIVVFAMNGALLCLPLLFFAGFISLKALLYFWLIKVSIDFLLLFKTIRFFEKDQLLFSYLWSSLLYPFFNVYVGITSIFSNYKWKGRDYNR